MAATAAARRVAASPARRATASRAALKQRPAPTRRKPARATRTRPAARGRSRAPAQKHRSGRSQTPITGFVPVVVGRTAGAVGGIADSGLVVRLTRGRLWIGVLGALLIGIVGLNVWALSLNAGSSKVAAQADQLRRANSALQAQIAGELSSEQVQAAAAREGLFVPEPDAIRYLEGGPDAAAIAARRLAAGELAVGAAPVAVAAPAAPAVVPTEPIQPAAATPEPVTPAPVETTGAPPATPAPAPAAGGAAGGGVVAP